LHLTTIKGTKTGISSMFNATKANFKMFFPISKVAYRYLWLNHGNHENIVCCLAGSPVGGA